MNCFEPPFLTMIIATAATTPTNSAAMIAMGKILKVKDALTVVGADTAKFSVEDDELVFAPLKSCRRIKQGIRNGVQRDCRARRDVNRGRISGIDGSGYSSIIVIHIPVVSRSNGKSRIKHGGLVYRSHNK